MKIKNKDVLLTFFGLYQFIQIYKELKPFIKTLFCKHEWRHWKIHLHCKHHLGIDDTILVKWRRCECCGKKQEMNMLPGNWYWEKSYYDLPEDNDTIHFDVDLNNVLTRREALSDKRDKKINKILN